MHLPVPPVTVHDFDERVLQAQGPVVIDFYADWCPACRRFEEPYAKVTSVMEDEATFLRFDLEQQPVSSQQADLFNSRLDDYHVQFIPAVRVFRDGQMICEPEASGDAETFQQNLEACLR